MKFYLDPNMLHRQEVKNQASVSLLKRHRGIHCHLPSQQNAPSFSRWYRNFRKGREVVADQTTHHALRCDYSADWCSAF